MTKQKMEQSPGEIPFEFSAMFVFGKFELFCTRLDNLVSELLKQIFVKLHKLPAIISIKLQTTCISF
jgi:hypothetical protein